MQFKFMLRDTVVKAEKPVRFVTAVWGRWHVDCFLNANLPTLLSGGNLPAMAATRALHYEIFTGKEDYERLNAAPVIIALREYMTITINLLGDYDLKSPFTTHHMVWRIVMDQAREYNEFALLMPPDVVWSDGSFGFFDHELSKGKRVIFMTFPRAVSGTFLPEIEAMGVASNGSLTVAPADLVKLCMQHIHPLMAAYSIDSDYFPHHAEMILSPVPGEGMSARVLTRELFLFDPDSVELTKDNLPDYLHVHEDEMIFVDDSDDVFSVSLAPLGQYANWHVKKAKADVWSVGKWWLRYDAALNDRLAAAKIRWHTGNKSPEKWQAVETRLDLFLTRALAIREGLRLWRFAIGSNRPALARLLVSATFMGVLGQITAKQGRRIVVLPASDTFEAIAEDLLEHLLETNDRRTLLREIRQRLAVLPPSTGKMDELSKTGGVLKAITLAGRQLVVARRGDDFFVNGLPTHHPVALSRNMDVMILKGHDEQLMTFVGHSEGTGSIS